MPHSHPHIRRALSVFRDGSTTDCFPARSRDGAGGVAGEVVDIVIIGDIPIAFGVFEDIHRDPIINCEFQLSLVQLVTVWSYSQIDLEMPIVLNVLDNGPFDCISLAVVRARVPVNAS